MAPAIAKTNHIAAQFSRQVQPHLHVEECMWSRGLLPAGKSTNLRDEPVPSTKVVGAFSDAAASSREIYTDGSGGPEHVIDTVRRVGAGAAAVDYVHSDAGILVKSVGLLFANCPGKQTVPRAETHAGAIALAAASASIGSWYCDALYTVKGSHPDCIQRMQGGRNGDLWVRLAEQTAAQGAAFAATKVRAHQTLQHVVARELTFKEYLGNGLADVAADVAADICQPERALVDFAQKSFANCVLLNLRLAAIEAHCWHAAALQQVPVPIFAPVPLATDLEAARAAALGKIKASRHSLYRRNGLLYCAHCQKRKILAKSHLWSSASCVPRPNRPDPNDLGGEPAAEQNIGHCHADAQPVAASEASHTATDPSLLPFAERRALFELARPNDAAPRPSGSRAENEPPSNDDFNLDRAIEDEAEFIADEFPPPMLPEDELVATCTVSAAKRARQADRSVRNQILLDNARVARQANEESATSTASGDLTQLLNVVDSNLPVPGPLWAAAAHKSHALYYFGGFVVCASCGMLAQRSIVRSKLTTVCQKHLSRERSLGVRRLGLGKLPRSDYSEWPDGGDDVRNGASMCRLAPFK